MNGTDPVAVGVIGVGSMGAHHARVYNELPGARLHGVADTAEDRAVSVADEYGTVYRSSQELIENVDAVSIAVPTSSHAELARACIEAGTDMLVEKPFVSDPADGRELAEQANAAELVLQVGHIERFNPAVQALFDLVTTEDIVAVRADRLGPPVGRGVTDDVVMDLMIHDIDVILTLLGARPRNVSGAQRNGKYASVLLEFDADVVGTLTASRVTQRKVRSLEVTTADRHLAVDYIDQSVRIHRRSRPAYLQEDAEMRYRHESIIEQPLIESAEPLRLQLESFLKAVRTRSAPVVTADDGLEALTVAWAIKDMLGERTVEVPKA